MATFLFWNLNRKPLTERITRIVTNYKVDIVILAECRISQGGLISEILSTTGRDFFSPFSQCRKIAILTGYPEQFLLTVHETDRFTIRSLGLPGLDTVLLAAAHLPSKLHWKAESQAFECERLATDIRRIEQEAGHTRTVLVGDLNVNPFESSIVGARSLHGVMTKSIAAKMKRTVQEIECPFFYNPMWGRLGDETIGPPGTYFDNRAEHVNYFWHTFDQVLVRPSLLSIFKNDELVVLTDDGEDSLILASGPPDAEKASDHLPLLFRLNL